MIARLTFLLVCVAVTSGNPAVGRPWHWRSPKPLVTPFGPVKSSRIVGGEEAKPHSWPHQVALFIDDLYFCGGSLISGDWVLTAAHCLDGAVFTEVVLGAHSLQADEESKVTMGSSYFVMHENWNSYFLINDIALVRLPRTVTFNEFIQPVGLPSTDLSEHTIVTATGWGTTSDSATDISDVLQQVDVPIMSNADCIADYIYVEDGQICTDSSGGKGVCTGDSGGPLNLDGKTHGISSYGSSEGCEAGRPQVFTRVHRYLKWIEQHTGITP